MFRLGGEYLPGRMMVVLKFAGDGWEECKFCCFIHTCGARKPSCGFLDAIRISEACYSFALNRYSRRAYGTAGRGRQI